MDLSSGANGSGSDASAQNNPVVQRYRQWISETPFVTRLVLQITGAMFIASFFISPYALVTVPYFTVMELEVYRPLLAPFFCAGILSLLFGVLAFYRTAVTLESAYGSTTFGLLFCAMALLSQALFLALCFMLALSGDQGALFWTAQGLWLVVLALIVVECEADGRPTRRLMFPPIEVSSRYYPLALFFLFSLFTGPRLDMACSLFVGYLYANKKLEWLRPSGEYVRRLEELHLSSVVHREGYIPIGAASGVQAWQVLNDPSAGGYSAWGATPGAPSAPPIAHAVPATRSPDDAAADGHRLGGASTSLSREELTARRAAALGSRSSADRSAQDARERFQDPRVRGSAPRVNEEDAVGPFEVQLMHLTSMGFSQREAGEALQACDGDLGAAVERLSGS